MAPTRFRPCVGQDAADGLKVGRDTGDGLRVGRDAGDGLKAGRDVADGLKAAVQIQISRLSQYFPFLLFVMYGTKNITTTSQKQKIAIF